MTALLSTTATTATTCRPSTLPARSIRSTGLFDRVGQLIALGKTILAMEGLAEALKTMRDEMTTAEWNALTLAAQINPLAAVLNQDPFTRRAFEKPRGYAGDAVMMDLIYGLYSYEDASIAASRVGYRVLEWIRSRPACTSVRLRRTHIARLIDEIAAVKPRPDILAIAAGHFREAEASTAISWGNAGRIVTVDADAESLAEVAYRYAHLGVETVKASVRDVLARKANVGGPFDFVYAAGLYDYLTETTAIALTAQMFDLTRPGGQLLIPNFTPDCPDAGYMEAFMAWKLIYRDEFDLAKLVEALPAQRVASYDICRDRTGSIAYLLIRKAK